MKHKTPLNWGQRFREMATAKGKSLKQVAEKLGRAESSVRSWTNGTRQINLVEFLDLCDAAGIDPAACLFTAIDGGFLAIGEAWNQADEDERKVFETVAEGILSKRGAVSHKSGPAPTIARRSAGRSRV